MGKGPTSTSFGGYIFRGRFTWHRIPSEWVSRVCPRAEQSLRADSRPTYNKAVIALLALAAIGEVMGENRVAIDRPFRTGFIMGLGVLAACAVVALAPVILLILLSQTSIG